MSIARLASLSLGFRTTYLDYDALTAQLRAWAEAFPEIVALRSVGKSREGRELWLLTLGKDPDRARPAAWVDGNMHASEVCGSSVALAIAEDVIALHLGASLEDETLRHSGLPAHLAESLREVLVYVMPRMSPDGAEVVLKTGRYVRSVPQDDRPTPRAARWISDDIDGDGHAFLMRKEDPGGEYVESPEIPGLLLKRSIEDRGPFYKVYGEGFIEDFDGDHVPSPYFLSDNEPDLNRNFPYSWAPEHEQAGAGTYPMSAPESRAVVEASSSAPQIFAWLNLHTFGGVYIRPLGTGKDTDMNREDLAIFKQVGEWAEALSGYPMVSGFEEFTYEPGKPLRGDLTDYAYHQRGAIAFVCELWDLFTQAGIARRKPFVDCYTHLDREDLHKLARFDARENASRALKPWRHFKHPQIGDVEIGGMDARVGFWNPPYERLERITREQSALFFRLMAMAPKVVLTLTTEPLADGLTRVIAEIENHGYLPTYVLASARSLAWNGPLFAEIDLSANKEGATLLSSADKRVEVGHLDGWGRGKNDGSGALYHLRSRGTTGRKRLEWIVRGRGEVSVHVDSVRCGSVSATLSL